MWCPVRPFFVRKDIPTFSSPLIRPSLVVTELFQNLFLRPSCPQVDEKKSWYKLLNRKLMYFFWSTNTTNRTQSVTSRLMTDCRFLLEVLKFTNFC